MGSAQHATRRGGELAAPGASWAPARGVTGRVSPVRAVLFGQFFSVESAAALMGRHGDLGDQLPRFGGLEAQHAQAFGSGASLVDDPAPPARHCSAKVGWWVVGRWREAVPDLYSQPPKQSRKAGTILLFVICYLLPSFWAFIPERAGPNQGRHFPPTISFTHQYTLTGCPTDISA